jgi:hypothetical protein
VEYREQIDHALGCLSLGAVDANHSASKVHVPPLQGQRLADPQAGERERRQQSTALALVGGCVLVELAGRVE